MKLAWFAAVALATLAGCPKSGYKAPSNLPKAKDVVAKLDQQRAARKSFRVETVMDYFLGKDRVKGTVYVMGTSQRQLRFHAEKPDGTLLIDMACNGQDFTYVDFQNNCYLSGPCDRHSVASLLRVELEPEDFHDLAQGTPPVLKDGDGTVTWDSNRGYEIVKLQGAAGTQTIAIDERDGRFDVVSSELVGKDGKRLWSVENTDFRVIKDAAGVAHRVPGKTRFKSPEKDADLIVEWKDAERAINLELVAAKFSVPIPAGVPVCAAKQPQTGQTP
ncbi:MAG TPA: hypothetical protein VFQ53_32515 [Kofleriaceae bacterium]|nr:hypothetical protein [Kofleriaceae bacterium]